MAENEGVLIFGNTQGFSSILILEVAASANFQATTA